MVTNLGQVLTCAFINMITRGSFQPSRWGEDLSTTVGLLTHTLKSEKKVDRNALMNKRFQFHSFDFRLCFSHDSFTFTSKLKKKRKHSIELCSDEEVTSKFVTAAPGEISRARLEEGETHHIVCSLFIHRNQSTAVNGSSCTATALHNYTREGWRAALTGLRPLRPYPGREVAWELEEFGSVWKWNSRQINL